MARKHLRAKQKARLKRAAAHNATPWGRVFAVYELTEAIFLQMPMYDILVTVQRTSKRRKAVVDSSSLLQESLFFKPVSDRALMQASYFKDALTHQHVLLNPFANHRFKRPYILSREITTPLGILYYNPYTDWNPAMLRPDASWRRQLLSQPPMSSLALDTDWYMDRRSGLTLQDFIDQVGYHSSWDDTRYSDKDERYVSLKMKVASLTGSNFEALQEVEEAVYDGCWRYMDY